MRKKLLLGLLALSTLQCLAQEEHAFYSVGIGYNYGRYLNNNNLKAFSSYLNFKGGANGRTLVKDIDLNKFHQGIALNGGVDLGKFSFYAEWHNGVMKDEIQYQQAGSTGIVSNSTESFRFRMNSFNLAAAYGIRYVKFGISLDYARFKYDYKNQEFDWVRADRHFNIGFTGFVEIIPVKFIKIKPYIQFGMFRERFTMIIPPYYEFSMNHFSNFGVSTFIQLPKSLK